MIRIDKPKEVEQVDDLELVRLTRYETIDRYGVQAMHYRAQVICDRVLTADVLKHIIAQMLDDQETLKKGRLMWQKSLQLVPLQPHGLDEWDVRWAAEENLRAEENRFEASSGVWWWRLRVLYDIPDPAAWVVEQAERHERGWGRRVAELAWGSVERKPCDGIPGCSALPGISGKAQIESDGAGRMSFAFRKHDFDLSQFDRCEEHGCVIMQVAASARPVCLLDWLADRSTGRTVQDVILRGRGEYDLPAVVLSNGFLLPIRAALDAASGRQGEVNESLCGWEVSDILYLRSETSESFAAELLPPGTEVDEDPGFLLYLDTQVLLFLLFDEEIRKIEP